MAGACGSYGILVDIKDPEKPVRLDFATDTLFSLWHTAVFSNDGKTVVFTDEFGGGTQPMCQASTMIEQGGNTILEITPQRKFKRRGYFKIPSAQTAQENCVSHNGGLIPVPGRNVMVQGWYQGGIDVIDFTDPDKPKEIAYFDRGAIDNPPPIDQGPVGAAAGGAAGGRGGRGGGSTTGGSWGAYYFNGRIYSSEIARGLDIVELTPTADLSANEIAAAKLITWTEYNPQSQPKIEWPAAFPVVRSYVDQLQRDNGLAAARITAINAALNAAEQQSGSARKTALNRLASEVDKDIAGAKDSAKVRTMLRRHRRSWRPQRSNRSVGRHSKNPRPSAWVFCIGATIRTFEADPFSVQTVQRDDSAVQRGSETMRPHQHVNIRPIQPADFEAVWQIFHEVVAKADTYAFAPDTTRDEALRLWVDVPQVTFVAELDGQVVGTYFLKPNQPALGSHVCNAGYMVARWARGKGVGESLCAHSMEEARRLGFRAMQFNFVVATNPAVRLWTRMGFATIGRLPEAFRASDGLYVDALVMYRQL